MSSGGDGSSGEGKRHTTDAAAAAVEVPVGEAQAPGISQYSAATESEVEGSSVEAGSSWPAMSMQQLQKLLVKLGLLRPPSTVSRQRWSRVSECNSALPRKLGMCLTFGKRPSR